MRYEYNECSARPSVRVAAVAATGGLGCGSAWRNKKKALGYVCHRCLIACDELGMPKEIIDLREHLTHTAVLNHSEYCAEGIFDLRKHFHESDVEMNHLQPTPPQRGVAKRGYLGHDGGPTCDVVGGDFQVRPDDGSKEAKGDLPRIAMVPVKIPDASNPALSELAHCRPTLTPAPAGRPAAYCPTHRPTDPRPVSRTVARELAASNPKGSKASSYIAWRGTS
jgi:hypothetical protein